MEVASMFHPYEGEPSASLRRRTECIPTKENRVHPYEEEPSASNEDFDED